MVSVKAVQSVTQEKDFIMFRIGRHQCYMWCANYI